MISHFANRSAGPSRQGMTLYIFRSSKNTEICAFAATASGEALPGKFGPWTSVGSVLPSRSLPHGLSRETAESGVKSAGFMLWRMKSTDI
jgi:hypothetical protein